MGFKELLLRPSATFKNKLAALCEPLERHFGVNHFYYHHLSDNGQLFLIGNHIKWIEKFCEEEVYRAVSFYRTSNNFTTGIYLHDYVDEFQGCISIAQKNGLFPCFQFMKKEGEAVEAFGFTLSNPSSQNKMCIIREMALLQQFCSVFKEKFAHVLHRSEDYKVDIVKEVGEQFYAQDSSPQLPKINKKSFLSEISSELGSLTLKEWSIFKLWKAGFSAKEIASYHQRSKRTVEHYIESIQLKLDCSTRGEANCKYQLESNFEMLDL